MLCLVVLLFLYKSGPRFFKSPRMETDHNPPIITLAGFIDEHEYRKMCETVHNGHPFFPGNFDNALEMFDQNGDGVIDINEFIELDRRFPMLMFPAFRLQEKMQKITLGEKQWTKIIEKIELSRHRQVFLNMNGGGGADKSKYKGVLRRVILPRLNIDIPQRRYLCIDDIDKIKQHNR